MFRITRDPSSGSFIQCLAKITVMVLSYPVGHDRTITVILNIFKYSIIIIIVSTNYIFVHLLDNKVF